MRTLLLLFCAAFFGNALAQGRGGGRGSTGIHGDESVLTFTDGTLKLGAMPASGYVLLYDGSLITGINKGSANGLATLGSDGRVPNAQLPSSAYSITGTWNADTDLTSPGGITLAGTTPAVGTAYAVTTSGSTDLGTVESWTAGDLAVYTAGGWAKVPASGVTSFNGRYGAVVPVAGDYDGLALNLAAASSFRSPQGASCSQTAEGAFCWDTDDFLTIGDGSSRKTLLNADAAAAAYIEDPGGSTGDLLYLSSGSWLSDPPGASSGVQAWNTNLDTLSTYDVTEFGGQFLEESSSAASARTKIAARQSWTVPATITTTDTAACGDWQRYDGTGVADFTITLPAVSGTSGCEICWKEIGGDGASVITVDGNASETIDNAANFTMTTAYAETCVLSDGSEWWRR
jgi:hypothetical protein